MGSHSYDQDELDRQIRRINRDESRKELLLAVILLLAMAAVAIIERLQTR